MTAHEGQHRPTTAMQANDGDELGLETLPTNIYYLQTTTVHHNDSRRKSMQACDSQRRPTQAHDSHTGQQWRQTGARDTHLEPRYVFETQVIFYFYFKKKTIY